jgi:uncharacterized protein
MYIQRQLETHLQNRIFGGKILILYGPRQAGKTTLVKKLLEAYSEPMRYIDCELLENRELLTEARSADLFSLVKQYKIVVFDEAQVVPNIGSVLKSLYDHHPEVQYIATGSSSFDLANQVSEPLTGRSLEFILYPLSLAELASGAFDAESTVPELMRFGGYPDLQNVNEQEKILRLKTLVSQYLYKNVLSVGGVKKPEVMTGLLSLLAHQIGHEVSYRELSNQLKTSQQTVERYIDILEKNFVVVRLSSMAGNMRNEVTRAKKVYFVDLGLRNAVIDRFQPIDPVRRNDVGQLFENCLIMERLKYLANHNRTGVCGYFWRTFSQQEVDYVEVSQKGEMQAYEFKWNFNKKVKRPSGFGVNYPEANFFRVTPREAYDFVNQE